MDLKAFITEVHQNAVNHGWYDEKRTDGTLRALMHDELSEALREYRCSRPMLWHKCHYNGGVCEQQDVHDNNSGCMGCEPNMRKPEGIAVELVDFAIRVFDYMGYKGVDVPCDTLNELMAESVSYVSDEEQDEMNGVYADLLDYALPDLVDLLHERVSLDRRCIGRDYLAEAAGVALAWIERRGMDAEALLREKHAFNVGRSYKHGGKVC